MTSAFTSTFTPDEEARWVEAMRRGVRVTDDGPAPTAAPKRKPKPKLRVLPPPEQPSDPSVTCQWCARRCGSESALAVHVQFCEAKPMEKQACIHHWLMEPPDGPLIHGFCKRCGATRADPASPEPRPMQHGKSATCQVCGALVGTGSTRVAHMRRAHPEEVAS